MTETGGEFGDPRPDRALRRRLREESARPLPMGTEVRALLKPFAADWYTECTQCGRAIGAPGETYYVERALRGDEPLFEFALCETCLNDFEDELSSESMLAIGRFWLRHCDLDDREERIEDAADADDLVATCLLSGEARTALDEFQVWAWCRDGQLLADPFAPAIVSGAMMERLGECLSQKTRDAMDGFVRDNLGLPPEMKTVPVLV